MLVAQGEKNKQVLLEISEDKNQYEVVNYHYLGKKQLTQKINRAKQHKGLVKKLAEMDCQIPS
jgi:hypothetical protein